MNGVTEQLALGGREASRQHIQVAHNVVDANAQVFHHLQLVVGIPEVACRTGSRRVTVLQAKTLFRSPLTLVAGAGSASEAGYTDCSRQSTGLALWAREQYFFMFYT